MTDAGTKLCRPVAAYRLPPALGRANDFGFRIPNRRYGNGLRRCGFGAEATRFFDIHVEADAVHGAIASTDLVEGFTAGEEERAQQVYFGARCLQLLDTQIGASWIRAWSAGSSTLREGS